VGNNARSEQIDFLSPNAIFDQPSLQLLRQALPQQHVGVSVVDGVVRQVFMALFVLPSKEICIRFACRRRTFDRSGRPGDGTQLPWRGCVIQPVCRVVPGI
jgi:hypothetical protein